MKKKAKLLLKDPIRLNSEEGKGLFSSQTLKEMDMAGLIGGDVPAPCGIIDIFCGTNLLCPNIGCGTTVNTSCGGGSHPGPTPSPGGKPGFAGSNCICTDIP